jgi:hypothetical protein
LCHVISPMLDYSMAAEFVKRDDAKDRYKIIVVARH